MNMNQRRPLAQWTFASLLLALSASAVFAQGSAGGAVVPSQFNANLQGHDRQLSSIEAFFGQLESTKSLGDRYSDDASSLMTVYAKAMMESYDTAIRQTELAAKSQGKEGSTALLNSFEDLAVRHENRLKLLDNKTQRILSQIKDGTIGVDKSFLLSMTPQERADFRQFLSPQAGKQLEQKNPELFKGLPAGRSSFILVPATVARVWPLLEKISDLLISPAYAAIGKPVAVACHTLPTPVPLPLTNAQIAACIQATQLAYNLGLQAQNTYSACWNSAKKPFQGFKRAQCLSTLIARLA